MLRVLGRPSQELSEKRGEGFDRRCESIHQRRHALEGRFRETRFPPGQADPDVWNALSLPGHSAASGMRAVFGVLLVALVGAFDWGRGVTAGVA